MHGQVGPQPDHSLPPRRPRPLHLGQPPLATLTMLQRHQKPRGKERSRLLMGRREGRRRMVLMFTGIAKRAARAHVSFEWPRHWNGCAIPEVQGPSENLALLHRMRRVCVRADGRHGHSGEQKAMAVGRQRRPHRRRCPTPMPGRPTHSAAAATAPTLPTRHTSQVLESMFDPARAMYPIEVDPDSQEHGDLRPHTLSDLPQTGRLQVAVPQTSASSSSPSRRHRARCTTCGAS